MCWPSSNPSRDTIFTDFLLPTSAYPFGLELYPIIKTYKEKMDNTNSERNLESQLQEFRRAFESPSPDPTIYYPWEETPAPESQSARAFSSLATPLPPSRPSVSPVVESREPSVQIYQVPPEVIAAPRPTRGLLTSDEQVSVMKWLLQHRGDYADNKITKARFWKNCAEYIQHDIGKIYRHIDRAVSKWVETRKEQVQEQIQASGVALADTDWKQVLDEWIEFLGDLEAERKERKDAKTAEEISAREMAQYEQERMATRMAARHRQLDEVEEDEEISIVGSSSSASRKRGKRAGGRDGGVEAYTQAMSTALSSFGSGFAKDIGSVISNSIKEPVNEMKDQIKELKEGQDGQQQLMLNILSEIRKLRNGHDYF